MASERDLYRLSGSEPELAEEMFGKIETAITPILGSVISLGVLPKVDSDDFVSLLSFVATLVLRHPDRFDTIEKFSRELMVKILETHAHHALSDSVLSTDGSALTREDLSEAVEALHNGKIKIEFPRDYSLGTALGTVQTLTEILMARSWTLASAEDSTFITSTHPVLLCWDQIDLHGLHSPGFGLENTTVYFPISSKFMMIGKFTPLRSNCVLDARMVAALNGLHGCYSPRFIISRDDSSTLQLGKMGTVRFGDLESAFRGFADSQNPI